MKRILVPIDFSDATPPVIDLARDLAKGLGAEIHLVHVKELSAAAAPGDVQFACGKRDERRAQTQCAPGFTCAGSAVLAKLEPGRRACVIRPK
jgi:hypothetical protein